MPDFLTHAQGGRADIIASLRELVECESPSDDASAVNRFVDLLSSKLKALGKVRTFPGGRFGKHLRCEFALPGPRRKQRTLLLLGHSDTVWPMGTLATMPWREAKGRLWGPGVLDMKAGLAFAIHAIAMLRELDAEVPSRVILQVNSDEEVGSPTSRALTEEAARGSEAVFVLEPGTGLQGKLKTARKGVGDYTVRVQGVAAHAGVDFANGASAILELAHQVQRIAGFTNLARGITVNPGIISGGTRTNVIAAEATARVDIRIAKRADEKLLERQFRSLKAVDRRCKINVEGGLNRPPMERSKGIQALFAKAQKVAAGFGLNLEESATGGGSDGNFTAAVGVPTLDGLGAVGEGAHANNESILIDRIADRVALLAGLIQAG